MFQPILGAYSSLMDTNLVNIVSDSSGYFDTIKALVISVVVFGLVVGYAKLIRKK